MGCNSSKAAAQQPASTPAKSENTLLDSSAADPTKGAAQWRIKLGAKFPDFECKTTEGDFSFHKFLSEGSNETTKECKWTILFSHPKDYTPVCTTELGVCQSLVESFKQKGVKLIGLSCDSVEDHKGWSKDVLAARGLEGEKFDFPLIADPNREIASTLGMLDPAEKDGAGVPMPARALFVIAPDMTNKLTILYPATTGRNFDEVLRVLESLKYTADFSLATPVNWKAGERLIVAPSVKTEDAKERFKNLEIKALPSGKEYLRYVDCPTEAPPNAVPVAASPAAAAAALPEGAFKIKIGAQFPDFECKTTEGDFSFHKFLQEEGKDKWTVLFSHPKDFTPVCTTELGECQSLVETFKEKGVKLIGLSCDSVEEHHGWAKDVIANRGLAGEKFGFPLIADPNREIASTLGMLDPAEKDGAGVPMPARALFVIGPDMLNKLTILYPATTGRDFNEVLRVVESLKYTADLSLATPVNWKAGERLIVAPSVKTEDAKERFQNLEIKALPSGKEYLRYVDCPVATGKMMF